MPKTPIDIDHLPDTAEAEMHYLKQEIVGLQRLLVAARDDQWRSPSPHFGAVSGQPNRPTENITLDPKRLALRARVLAAERVLATAAATIHTAAEELGEALSAYYEE